MKPQGRYLRAAARLLCSKKTIAGVIEPAIADLQHERDAASAAGHRWRARRVAAAGYAGVCKALALCARDALVRGVTGRGAPDEAAGGVIGLALLAFAVVTALLVLPPLHGVKPWLRTNVTFVTLCLVPQAVPLSLPFGIAIGIGAGLCGRPITRRVLTLVLFMGLAATALSFATREWMIPASNQTFREIVARQAGVTVTLQRGLNETPLSQLARRDDDRSKHHLQLMLAVCAGPLALAMFSAAASTLTHRRAFAGLLSLAGPAIYYVLLWTLDSRLRGAGQAPAWLTTAGLWLPVAALTLPSLARLRSAARRARA